MPKDQQIIHKSADGKSEINLVKYTDKNGKENYVTQLKSEGKEIFHTTKHPDGTVNYTDKNGRTKLR